jgi:hypothetical protein
MDEETTTTTTTTTTLNPDVYRFSGYRYSLRAPDKCGPNDIIMEVPSLFTFPKKDE